MTALGSTRRGFVLAETGGAGRIMSTRDESRVGGGGLTYLCGPRWPPWWSRQMSAATLQRAGFRRPGFGQAELLQCVRQSCRCRTDGEEYVWVGADECSARLPSSCVVASSQVPGGQQMPRQLPSITCAHFNHLGTYLLPPIRNSSWRRALLPTLCLRHHVQHSFKLQFSNKIY